MNTYLVGLIIGGIAGALLLVGVWFPTLFGQFDKVASEQSFVPRFRRYIFFWILPAIIAMALMGMALFNFGYKIFTSS